VVYFIIVVCTSAWLGILLYKVIYYVMEYKTMLMLCFTLYSML